MIVTSGGRFAGFGMYLLKGKPVFLWNLLDLEHVKWEGPDALTPGQHTIEFDSKYDGLGVGTMAYNNFSASVGPRTPPSRSMARWSRPRRWRGRFPSSCNGMRASTSAPTRSLA